MGLDFAKIRENALKDGIDLQEIPIKYENLTDSEIEILETKQTITHRLSKGCVLAKFPRDGKPLFQEKATAVIPLGA